MKISHSVALALFLGFAFVAVASAGDLDPQYLTTFGAGSILPSGKGLPQKSQYDPAQFDVRDGCFFIPGGYATATLDARVILPAGETYGSLIEKLKKENPAGAQSVGEDAVWLIWFSHDLEGNRQDQTWPASASAAAVPSRAPDAIFHSSLEERMMPFNTVGLTWPQLCSASPIADWLARAKPGDRIFLAHTVGFLHPAAKDAAASGSTSLQVVDCGNHDADLALAVGKPQVATIITVSESR